MKMTGIVRKMDDLGRVTIPKEILRTSNASPRPLVGISLRNGGYISLIIGQSTMGIIRQIDSLGRLVIPKEIRRTLKIKAGDSIEFFIKENELLIRKFSSGCIFCGESKNTITYKNVEICRDCSHNIHVLSNE